MSALTAIHAIPTRPHLYLVEDERPQRLSASVYRRRRIFAVAVAILSVVTLWVTATSVVSAISGEPAAASAVAVPEMDGNGGAGWYYWTVRPGDTLWTIAQAIRPSGDIRPVLEKLQAKYGNTPLTPGMNISIR